MTQEKFNEPLRTSLDDSVRGWKQSGLTFEPALEVIDCVGVVKCNGPEPLIRYMMESARDH